jgi:hypothetical protein
MSDAAIHLGKPLDASTLEALADFICGDDKERFPIYRSSTYLTRFFKTAALQIAEDNGMQRTSLCAAADAGRYAPLKRASPQSHTNGTRRNT